MNSELRVFDFGNRKVRITVIEGESWWVAADVCEVLGHTNPTEAVKALDDDEKNTLRISEDAILLNSLGINVNNPMTLPNGLNIISESGLYTLIIRSNKPEAKKFRRWVTHEVLPSIRKSGAYGLDSYSLYGRAVELSEDTISPADFAKLMCQKGIIMGRNKFLQWLAANGYALKPQCGRYSSSQRAVEGGLLKYASRVLASPGGDIRSKQDMAVTGRGQVHFARKLLDGQAALIEEARQALLWNSQGMLDSCRDWNGKEKRNVRL